MRANHWGETLDIVVQTAEEIDTLYYGRNIDCRFNFNSVPNTKLILRCREEAREDPDQLLFSWFDDYEKTQPLTESGYWIETVPRRTNLQVLDLLTEDAPEKPLYETILVTIDKRRLAELAQGDLEDNCLLTRCIFDRMQIRYYPQHN